MAKLALVFLVIVTAVAITSAFSGAEREQQEQGVHDGRFELENEVDTGDWSVSKPELSEEARRRSKKIHEASRDMSLTKIRVRRGFGRKFKKALKKVEKNFRKLAPRGSPQRQVITSGLIKAVLPGR